MPIGIVVGRLIEMGGKVEEPAMEEIGKVYHAWIVCGGVGEDVKGFVREVFGN
jgi:hypothetical protein